MSEMKNFVNELVLGYFSKINASVHENNGLYEFTVPDNFKKIFGDNVLKITFDENLSKSTDYELVSPGSSVLSVILNECIKFGPTVIGRSTSNDLEKTLGLKSKMNEKADNGMTGRVILKNLINQILKSAAKLHERGIVHRWDHYKRQKLFIVSCIDTKTSLLKQQCEWLNNICVLFLFLSFTEISNHPI